MTVIWAEPPTPRPSPTADPNALPTPQPTPIPTRHSLSQIREWHSGDTATRLRAAEALEDSADILRGNPTNAVEDVDLDANKFLRAAGRTWLESDRPDEAFAAFNKQVPLDDPAGLARWLADKADSRLLQAEKLIKNKQTEPARQSLESAIEQYEQALISDAEVDRAAHNLVIARRRLAQINPPPTPSPTPTPTPNPSPTPSASPTPSPSPSPTPSGTPTPTPEASPTPDPSGTPTPTPDPAGTPTPNPAASPTPDPNGTPDPNQTPTPDPNASPTPDPNATPQGSESDSQQSQEGQEQTMEEQQAAEMLRSVQELEEALRKEILRRRQYNSPVEKDY